MNIEAMRLWAKHDQGHASTYLSLEDARLIVDVYDKLVDSLDDHMDVDPEVYDLIRRMEGV